MLILYVCQTVYLIKKPRKSQVKKQQSNSYFSEEKPRRISSRKNGKYQYAHAQLQDLL